jgi:endonuclease/exonuclease/phosphatase family metal-dependent hydrolase
MKTAIHLLLLLCLVACKSAAPKTAAKSTPSKPTASKVSTPTRLKILTYNIHHCEGTDGKLDLPRIAEVIKNSGADLVALQEVDRNAQRTGNVDQAAELGRLTGLHPAFGAAMFLQGGHYGQAILSRLPIEKYTVHQLPQQPGREPRIALAAKIRELLFVSTHLDHEREEIRVQQAEKLNQILVTNTLPVVLLGDFNSTPTNQTMQVFAEWGNTAGSNPEPTIPSETPRRRIDYILLHPASSWSVRESKVVEEPVASDHRPVFAVIERRK